MFDETEYKKRNNEGIFGAEETKNHWLHWWFKPANMRRFDKIRGITRNLKAPNRLLCAKKLGIPIPSYPNNERAAAESWPRQTPLTRVPAC